MSHSTNILVTGGCGFVGSRIVSALSQAHPEWKIFVTDLKPEAEYISPHPSILYLQADIRHPFEATNAVEWSEATIVVHTAGGVPSGPSRYSRRPQDVHNITRINVDGTRNMLDAAQECGVIGFVYTSSYTIITDDLDHDFVNINEDWPIPKSSLIYGESKAQAERLVLEANGEELSTCALRPSVVFGEEDYALIPSLYACIEKGETSFQVGDGTNLYDFTYVGNVADAHVLAVENLLKTKTAAGQAIFISNKQPVTFRDFSLALWANFGHFPPRNIYIPSRVAWGLGFVAEVMTWFSGRPNTLSRGSVKDATRIRYASQKKAQEVLKYKPRVGLVEGLRQSCQAYKDRLAKGEKGGRVTR